MEWMSGAGEQQGKKRKIKRNRDTKNPSLLGINFHAFQYRKCSTWAFALALAIKSQITNQIDFQSSKG